MIKYGTCKTYVCSKCGKKINKPLHENEQLFMEKIAARKSIAGHCTHLLQEEIQENPG